MTLPKLNLAPEQDSYGFTMPTGILMATLDGGPPRTRLDVTGGYIPVQCQWKGSRSVLFYLQQAYRYTEANGGAHFLVDLVLDDGVLTEREAMFQPGSGHLVGTQGDQYVWGATLLVKPILGLDTTWPVPSTEQSALLSAENGDLLVT